MFTAKMKSLKAKENVFKNPWPKECANKKLVVISIS